MYAISRMLRAKNAWCWRVCFRRRGVRYGKGFFDLACGGESAALAQAIAWRDQQLAAIEPLPMQEFCAMKRSNNTSGVPGVHFVKSPRQPLGAWQAKITLANGVKTTRAFSVRQYGDREAFRRAVAARTQLLALADDRTFLHDEEAKGLSCQGVAPDPATG